MIPYLGRELKQRSSRVIITPIVSVTNMGITVLGNLIGPFTGTRGWEPKIPLEDKASSCEVSLRVTLLAQPFTLCAFVEITWLF